jgi:hypothetical protein
VARDATARLYDVDADTVVLDQKKGTIIFRAKKGRLVNLDKLHESIWATRLSGNTGMRLNWIDVTAEGQVVFDNKDLVLKVAGSDEQFILENVPDALRKAVERGERVVSVTGRLSGWTGHFPVFLRSLPDKPRRIGVEEFQAAAK